MSDVFLIHPPVSFVTDNPKSDIIPDCPPLGLLYLACGLNKLGLSVRILDAVDGAFTIKDILELVNRDKPKVIGITAMTMNIRGAVQLAKAIKEKLNSCQVCLGGPHISADPGIIERFPFFNFGLTGEADITFPHIVNEIVRKNKSFTGIIKAQVPMNLDEISHPARELIDWDYYKKQRGLWANAIIATRGCPFNCIFCSIPAISRTYRVRAPDLIVEEMEQTFKLNGIKTFIFIDDIFTLRRDYVIGLCKEIKNSYLKFRWEAQTKANLVDDALLKEMRKAGCYKLIFGIESGNERIRNQIINKKISDKEIQQANKLCWNNGIEPDWYLMLGFPTETKAELDDTVNFPLKIRPNPNIIGVHIATPLPGARFFKSAQEKGTLPLDVIDEFISGKLGQGYKDTWPYYVPEGLTIEDLKIARTQAYKRFYFRPKYIFRRLRRDCASLTNLKKDIKQCCALLKYGHSAEDR